MYTHLKKLPLLVAVLCSAPIATAQPVATSLSLQFQPDPVSFQGSSGGSQATPNCGQIGTNPNHVVQLNDDFPHLRFTLQGAGQPTLWIRLPNGRTSCILAPANSTTINAPGYWERGTYAIYVGDRAGGSHTYTLTITQRRQ
jgi:hypothetical protein